MKKKPEQPLEERWQYFAKSVIPIGASAIQRQEMRRSFYAGASAMFGLFTNIDAGVSDDDGAAVLSALQQECVDSLSRVGKDC